MERHGGAGLLQPPPHTTVDRLCSLCVHAVHVERVEDEGDLVTAETNLEHCVQGHPCVGELLQGGVQQQGQHTPAEYQSMAAHQLSL